MPQGDIYHKGQPVPKPLALGNYDKALWQANLDDVVLFKITASCNSKNQA